MTGKKFRAYKRYILSIAFILLGLTGILLGIYRGEHGFVLQKAVRICLECIGIG